MKLTTKPRVVTTTCEVSDVELKHGLPVSAIHRKLAHELANFIVDELGENAVISRKVCGCSSERSCLQCYNPRRCTTRYTLEFGIVDPAFAKKAERLEKENAEQAAAIIKLSVEMGKLKDKADRFDAIQKALDVPKPALTIPAHTLQVTAMNGFGPIAMSNASPLAAQPLGCPTSRCDLDAGDY
jgi:hypothetical protein